MEGSYFKEEKVEKRRMMQMNSEGKKKGKKEGYRNEERLSKKKDGTE